MANPTQLSLTILGEPFAKQSMRVTRSGHRYTPSKVRKGQANLRAQIVQQLPGTNGDKFKPWQGPVRVRRVLFVFPRPKNHYRTGKYAGQLKDWAPTFVTKRPDLTDNLMKGLFDAMNGVVFLDDKQVVEVLHTRKIFGEKPRIEVEIEEIEEE